VVVHHAAHPVTDGNSGAALRFALRGPYPWVRATSAARASS
jgi:hypothetical protein